MKIIKCRKMSSGKYKVELDNGQEMTIYEDVIVNRELLGKELDANLLLKIDKDNCFADIYNKAIRYIATRLRSIKEMDKYLKEKNITELERYEIIDKLKDIGLLDDEAFASAYINDKLYLTSQGFVKIKNYLLQHNIDEDIINRLWSKVDIDYDERIRQIIQKQLQHHKGQSKMILRNKIYNYLLNLGYDSSDILKNLDFSHMDDGNQMEQEYDKLYQKLSKKYQDKELINQLKRKLYQKGFDYSAVNDLVANKNEI